MRYFKETYTNTRDLLGKFFCFVFDFVCFQSRARLVYFLLLFELIFVVFFLINFDFDCEPILLASSWMKATSVIEE